jgi:hypothetical protein
MRGIILESLEDYFNKEREIHNLLNNNLDYYNSEFYCGDGIKAHLYTVEDKPIILEPKNKDFLKLLNDNEIYFSDFSVQIIKHDF